MSAQIVIVQSQDEAVEQMAQHATAKLAAAFDILRARAASWEPRPTPRGWKPSGKRA